MPQAFSNLQLTQSCCTVRGKIERGVENVEFPSIPLAKCELMLHAMRRATCPLQLLEVVSQVVRCWQRPIRQPAVLPPRNPHRTPSLDAHLTAWAGSDAMFRGLHQPWSHWMALDAASHLRAAVAACFWMQCRAAGLKQAFRRRDEYECCGRGRKTAEKIRALAKAVQSGKCMAVATSCHGPILNTKGSNCPLLNCHSLPLTPSAIVMRRKGPMQWSALSALLYR